VPGGGGGGGFQGVAGFWVLGRAPLFVVHQHFGGGLFCVMMDRRLEQSINYKTV
jgi:hypothetical protein